MYLIFAYKIISHTQVVGMPNQVYLVLGLVWKNATGRACSIFARITYLISYAENVLLAPSTLFCTGNCATLFQLPFSMVHCIIIRESGYVRDLSETTSNPSAWSAQNNNEKGFCCCKSIAFLHFCVYQPLDPDRNDSIPLIHNACFMLPLLLKSIKYIFYL